GGRRQKGQPFFQLVHFSDRCAHQCTINGGQALQCWTALWRLWIGDLCLRGIGTRLSKLSGQLRIAGLKQSDQRTLAERSTHRLNFGELIATAEDVEKIDRVPLRAPKNPELVEDDAPARDRQERENPQNG